MIIFILILVILSLLLSLYSLIVLNNGFTIIKRDIKSNSIKNEILIKKADEIVAKWGVWTKNIVDDLKGE